MRVILYVSLSLFLFPTLADLEELVARRSELFLRRLPKLTKPERVGLAVCFI